MSRIFTYVLAVVGLGVVLSLPQARKGLDAVAGFFGNMGSALAKAADKPVGGAAAGVAVSTAPLPGADVSALLPDDTQEPGLGTDTENNSEPDKDDAVNEKPNQDEDAQDDSGAELVKVLEIYKNAERNKGNDN